MGGKLTLAALQFTAEPDWESHAETVQRLVCAAAAAGAQLVATPEHTGGLCFDSHGGPPETFSEETHPAIPTLVDLAVENGIWLLCGSLRLQVEDTPERAVSRSLLFAPDGRIVARYEPGSSPQVVVMDGVRLGLTTGSDLRHPALYQQLATAGADVLAVPGAFPVTTGEAHWEVLLRARAIETGCYVLAPSQCGSHAGGRQSWGHSLIVDPWGRVLANAGTATGIAMAVVDLDRIGEPRRALPVLHEGRDLIPA